MLAEHAVQSMKHQTVTLYYKHTDQITTVPAKDLQQFSSTIKLLRLIDKPSM